MATRRSTADHTAHPGRVLNTIGWLAIGLGALFVLKAILSTPTVLAVRPALAALDTPASAAVVARWQSQAPWRWAIAEMPAIGIGISLLVMGILVLGGRPAGRDGLVSLCTLCLWITLFFFLWRGAAVIQSLLGHGAGARGPLLGLKPALLLGAARDAALLFLARAYLLSANVTEALKAVSRTAGV